MELQNANLITYCIPLCGVEPTTFIPAASEAVMFISLLKKTYTTVKKKSLSLNWM
jgi:hypothetical protein